MLQNLSLIVCTVLWFFLHMLTWMWFSMWVYVKYIFIIEIVYEYLNLTLKLIYHNTNKPFGKSYAIKMLHYYFCHIYLPNIIKPPHKEPHVNCNTHNCFSDVTSMDIVVSNITPMFLTVSAGLMMSHTPNNLYFLFVWWLQP